MTSDGLDEVFWKSVKASKGLQVVRRSISGSGAVEKARHGHWQELDVVAERETVSRTVHFVFELCGQPPSNPRIPTTDIRVRSGP